MTTVKQDRLKPVDERLTQVHPRPAMLWPGATNEDLLIKFSEYVDLVRQYECQIYGIRGDLKEWCTLTPADEK